jgi:DNA-binding XRE family transcriptional regulator
MLFHARRGALLLLALAPLILALPQASTCRHHTGLRAPTASRLHARRRRRRGLGTPPPHEDEVALPARPDPPERRIADDEVRYLLAAQDALRTRHRAEETEGAEPVPGWLRSTGISLTLAYRRWLNNPLLVPADTLHRLQIESHACALYWQERGLDGTATLRALHEHALARMYLDALDLEPARAAAGPLAPPLTVTQVGLEELYAKIAEAERYLHLGGDPRFTADARQFRDVLQRLAALEPVWLSELDALRQNAISGEQRRQTENGGDDYATSRALTLTLLDRLAGAGVNSPQIPRHAVLRSTTSNLRERDQRGTVPAMPTTPTTPKAREAQLVATNLKRLRAERHLNQAQLAELLDPPKHREDVARWESGAHAPGPDSREAICRALEIPLSELFREPEDEQ